MRILKALQERPGINISCFLHPHPLSDQVLSFKPPLGAETLAVAWEKKAGGRYGAGMRDGVGRTLIYSSEAWL